MAEDGSATAAEPVSGRPEQPSKHRGKVKWFNSSKGYGFLTPDEGNNTEDVFVHQTAIHAQGFRSLQQGEEVEYVAEEGQDGRWRAVEVTGPRGVYVQGAARYGNSRGRRGRAQHSFAPAAAAPIPTPLAASSFPRFGGICYSCGLIGHMARDCRSPTAGCYLTAPAVGRGRGRGGSGRSGPPLPLPLHARSCYACGVMGHLQRDCPTFSAS